MPDSPRQLDRDDFDDFLDEELQNPEFAAAFEDAEERSRLILELVAARKNGSLTQGAVAFVMSTTQSAISDLESAGTDPRLSTIQRYARAVGVRLTFAVTRPEEVPQPRFSFTAHRGTAGEWPYFDEAVLAATRQEAPRYNVDPVLEMPSSRVEIAA